MGFGGFVLYLVFEYENAVRQYERDTWYDAQGRIVFTNSKGPVGVGLPRKAGKKDEPVTLTTPGGRSVSGAFGWDDVGTWAALVVGMDV